MLNKNRKRKVYHLTLSDTTNDLLVNQAQRNNINKSKQVEEAIRFYEANYIAPTLEDKVVVEDDCTHNEVSEIQVEDKWDKWGWLDNIAPTVDINDTRNTKNTLQQDNQEMKFTNFAHLMTESEKYEIKGTQTVVKDQYKDQEDHKQPLNSMSSLIQEAQESGLSLKH